MRTKLFTTILCIMLALMLPLSAMAGSQYTLSFTPGEGLAQHKSMTDLFSILKLRGSTEGSAASFTMSLNDIDVLSLALRGTADGLYLQSSALNPAPLYLSWTGLTDAAKTLLGGLSLSEENSAEITSVIDKLRSLIGSELTADGTDASANELIPSGLTVEEKLAKAKELFAGDPEMAAFISDIVGTAVVTDGDFTSDKHDPATQKVEITMTNADFVRLCDTNYMKTMVEQAAKISGVDTTPDELMAQVRQAYTDSNISTVITVLANNAGSTIVSISIPMTMNLVLKEDGKETIEDATFDCAFNRLTVNGCPTLNAEAKVILNDKALITAEASHTSGTDDTSTGYAALLAESTELYADYTKTPADGGHDRTVKFYIREGATALIEPAASDSPALTVKLESRPSDDEALKALLNTTIDTAVKPLDMSEEESKAFQGDLINNLMQTLVLFMGNLPTSVMETITPILEGLMQ